jgi:hypothetical protein
LAQVLEQIQPALARANQVQVAVAVDVDGGELKAGSGGARREIVEGEALLDFLRGVLGRLSLKDDMLDPVLGLGIEMVPGDE